MLDREITGWVFMGVSIALVQSAHECFARADLYDNSCVGLLDIPVHCYSGNHKPGMSSIIFIAILKQNLSYDIESTTNNTCYNYTNRVESAYYDI